MSKITEEELRTISVQNCEKIGEGMFSEVLLLTNKTIIKVIDKKMPFESIVYEFETSQKAHEIGIPCPKVYEIVKTELGYGIIYERIEGVTLNKYLKKHPKMYAIYARKYAEMLKKLHKIHAEKPQFESIKKIYSYRLEKFVKYGLKQDEYDFYKKILNAVPEENCLLHGDPRLTNIMITKNCELKFIDLDNLSFGNPIFDICAACYTLCLMSKRHPLFIKLANGIGAKKSLEFWKIFLQNYFETNNPEKLGLIEKISEELARFREISYLNKPKPKFGIFVDAYIHLVKNKFFK
ncbi:MAG: phosphotransferase, partial [Clostridia bacterium]|nr:phosphotransferase [Clostridia bacterium]